MPSTYVRGPEMADANRVTRDIGPWTMVPRWVVTRCTPRALRLYIELGLRADNETKACFPSHATLAEAMECSTDTIQRAQAELIQAGCIHVEQRRTAMGDLTSNLYTVMSVDPFSTGSRNGAVTPPQTSTGGTRTSAAVTKTQYPDKGSQSKNEWRPPLGPQELRDEQCPICDGSGEKPDHSVCDCFLRKAG